MPGPHALITPVTPTTKAQVRVTTPIRLCRSSQRRRRDLSVRTLANSLRRINGRYSTVPEMIASTNRVPIEASSSSDTGFMLVTTYYFNLAPNYDATSYPRCLKTSAMA